MTTYAIGDVQGCADALDRLLEAIGFDAGTDHLWFCGDLVNRGGQSLRVLRRVFDLRDRVRCVLGNHDMALLRRWVCGETPGGSELREVLKAPDATDLLEWLRNQPLLVRDDDLGVAMTHAGLLPAWSIEQAEELAAWTSKRILRARPKDWPKLFGRKPDRWTDKLSGWDRARFVVNAMTRMRFVDAQGTRLDFDYKGAPGSGQPQGLMPWFEVGPPRAQRIIFGHWSTLGFYSGRGVLGLDTGCVWGGSLTAVSLDDPTSVVSVRHCDDRS